MHPMSDFFIHVTESAKKRITEIAENDQKLRISVKGGGCSGFQYNYELVSDQAKDNEYVFSEDGATILIDQHSQNFLKDITFDYIEELGNAYFNIKNPVASAKCGCGNSFDV
jgi:iron-sulfur cluster assembly accessory protein